MFFFFARWSSGLQSLARVSALYQEETRSPEMEERFSCDTQIHRIILKENLLDKSQVPHAPSTYKKAPNYCLNNILKFY